MFFSEVCVMFLVLLSYIQFDKGAIYDTGDNLLCNIILTLIYFILSM